MAIKRYTTEELIDICTNIFYDYVSSSPTYYSNGEEKKCNKQNPTPIDFLHSEYLEMIEEIDNRQDLYRSEIIRREQIGDMECAQLLSEQYDILSEERELISNSNMSTQKKRYLSTNKIDYSRTALRIPLNKKINSFYDDFVLDVLFYDDVCTLKGKYDEYKELKTTEERIDFIRDNTEITHMGLVLLRQNSNDILTCIGLLGKQNKQDYRVVEERLTLLPHKFSDFGNLHLSDLNIIKNNDLRQILQSKIDLDKEDMKLLATVEIRGSEYKLLQYKNENKEELYIRYVCDSTGRPYYNLLDINNLRLSDYFNEKDHKSYLKAWWNITHLGASVDGKPVIAC